MDNRKHKKARTEVDDNVALVAALRAQIAKLEQKFTKLEQVCTKLEQERTKLKNKKKLTMNANAALRAEFAQLEQKRSMYSLLSVLPGEAKGCIPRLQNRGTDTSHTAPKNEKANETKRNFIVPDVIPVCRELGVDLTKPSCFRATISNSNNQLVYENEYDVKSYVHDSLSDATYICNEIIKKIAARKKMSARIVLSVRHESSIFSNIFDNTVVFDRISGAPVFSVKTKMPWGSLTEKVYGQLYDQLREMQAKGHPNPFGALTCIDKTYIFWLDNSYSKAVLNKLENDSNVGYSTNRLDSIVDGFPIKDASVPPTGQYCTQSPAKEKTPDRQYVGDTTGFIPLASHEMLQSDRIESEGMIAAFVSAIISSLDGFQKPREIKNFEKGEKVEVKALCLSSKSHEWGTLRTVHKGPKKKEWTGNQEDLKNLYLVDHLGTGSTSKVYRALTKDGYDCVVKMYVQRRNADKVVLSENKFKSIANKAVNKEVKMLKGIYKELKNYVWKQTFEGMPCVILPYFKHPDKIERDCVLAKIKERLLNCFSTNRHFYAFAPSDRAWRHVGYFNDELYLFDLAELEERDIAERDELVDIYIDKLRGKIGE